MRCQGSDHSSGVSDFNSNCRTGSPYTALSIVRDLWIIARSALDFLTDSCGPSDGRYWAFICSLTQPLYTACRYLRNRMFRPCAEIPASATVETASRRGAPTTSSQCSVATTRNAFYSVSSRRCVGEEVTGSRCANGLLLRRRADQPPTSIDCKKTDVRRCRISIFAG